MALHTNLGYPYNNVNFIPTIRSLIYHHVDRSEPLMRIACFGWVDAESGSVASGNHLLIEACLALGHEIDLFGEQGFVNPPRLRSHPGYRYIPLPQRFVTRRSQSIGPEPSVTNKLINEATLPAFIQLLHRALVLNHSIRHYDAVVFLGLSALCRLNEVPVISWVQGSSIQEAKAFRRSRYEIVSASNWFKYALYSNYYRMDRIWGAWISIIPDLTICCSKWTRDALIEDRYDPNSVAILPYPIDMDRFVNFDAAQPDRPETRILHLGRCDPRKRIDLLVSAFRLLKERLPEIELQVVGRPGIVPGIIDVLRAPDLSSCVRYLSGAPRDRVPGILGDSDLLVQTSECENFGSSVAEALACGVPVVIGPTNGMADYIDAGSEVFSSYSAQSVASSIERVLERNWANGRILRQRRREKAQISFSSSSVASVLSPRFEI